MLFLTFSNIDIQFAERKLTWSSYTLSEALSMTKRVQVIDGKKFAATALDLFKEAFMIHVAYFDGKMLIYLAREA